MRDKTLKNNIKEKSIIIQILKLYCWSMKGFCYKYYSTCNYKINCKILFGVNIKKDVKKFISLTITI